MGRRGEVWDREGEEGMRVIQRKGKGRKEGKGREGRKEGKEEDNLAPQTKFLDPPLFISLMNSQLNIQTLRKKKTFAVTKHPQHRLVDNQCNFPD
jgi:hypothetical protein